jgi:hypothetical protein
MRRLPRLWRLQRVWWLPRLRRLQGLPLRRRLRWLWRWHRLCCCSAGGMHRVLRIMGPLPLVLGQSI